MYILRIIADNSKCAERNCGMATPRESHQYGCICVRCERQSCGGVCLIAVLILVAAPCWALEALLCVLYEMPVSTVLRAYAGVTGSFVAQPKCQNAMFSRNLRRSEFG